MNSAAKAIIISIILLNTQYRRFITSTDLRLLPAFLSIAPTLFAQEIFLRLPGRISSLSSICSMVIPSRFYCATIIFCQKCTDHTQAPAAYNRRRRALCGQCTPFGDPAGIYHLIFLQFKTICIPTCKKYSVLSRLKFCVYQRPSYIICI